MVTSLLRVNAHDVAMTFLRDTHADYTQHRAESKNGRNHFEPVIRADGNTTHEQWLDIVHVCQQAGYHDLAMDILCCVTELFAANPAAAGLPNNIPLFPPLDRRRFEAPVSGRSDAQSEKSERLSDRRPAPVQQAWRGDSLLSQHSVAPPQPASLPRLAQRRKPRSRRHNHWANGGSSVASEADAELSDTTLESNRSAAPTE